MIQERVLIVEDRRELAIEFRDAICCVADESTTVEIAHTFHDGVSAAKKRDLAYCVLDLNVPERLGVDPKTDDDVELGFRLLEHICRTNPFAEIVIASRWADEKKVSVLRNRLWMQGYPVRDVFNKNEESDVLIQTLESDLRGLAQLKDHFAGRGVGVFHPLERRLVRRLWEKAAIPTTRWPTPLCMLRGNAGAGKSRWAVEYCELVSFVRRNPARRSYIELDCGQLSSSESSVDPQITLFGARNFQNVRDCAGVFERATSYNDNASLASGKSAVNFADSGTVILQEFANLPFDCQRLLLTVLDRNEHTGGRMTPAGGGQESIPIGCSVLLTTNTDLESRIVDSAHAEPGDLNEALFQRLAYGKDSWMHVPSMAEMGFDTFVAHLQWQISRLGYSDVEIAPNALHLLDEVFAQYGDSMNVRAAESIGRAFAHDQSNPTRLRHGHVTAGLAYLRLQSRSTITKPQPSNTALPIPAVIQRACPTRKQTASELIVAFVLRQLDNAMTEDEHRQCQVVVSDEDLQVEHSQRGWDKSVRTVLNCFSDGAVKTGIEKIVSEHLEKCGYTIEITKNRSLIAKLLEGFSPPQIDKSL